MNITPSSHVFTVVHISHGYPEFLVVGFAPKNSKLVVFAVVPTSNDPSWSGAVVGTRYLLKARHQ